MGFLAEIVQPAGLWSKIIYGMEGAVGNYVVAIILVTLLVKLVMVPFDFYNKLVTKKNTRKQAVLQPAMEKIKRQYASNPQMQNQKTMELYKRENYSVFGTCIGMLVYMALSITIFITLLNGFNDIAAYKMYEEYTSLKEVYNVTYEFEKTENGATDEEATLVAEGKVVEAYADVKNGFLWIKNIWRPDTWVSSVVSFDDYNAQVSRVRSEKLTDEELAQEKAEYEKIITNSFANDENGTYSKWNGYLILPILAAGLTYGSMKVSNYISKRKAQKKNLQLVQAPEAGKGMQFIMPAIMGIFTLLYNAAFGIYIVVGALFGFVASPLISMIVDNIDYKQQLKEESKKTVSYSRNNRR